MRKFNLLNSRARLVNRISFGVHSVGRQCHISWSWRWSFSENTDRDIYFLGMIDRYRQFWCLSKFQHSTLQTLQYSTTTRHKAWYTAVRLKGLPSKEAAAKQITLYFSEHAQTTKNNGTTTILRRCCNFFGGARSRSRWFSLSAHSNGRVSVAIFCYCSQ